MMKKNTINISETTEERFGMYFSIYRISGVEILPSKSSRTYIIYSVCAFACSEMGTAAMILYILQHVDDLENCMTGIQAVVATTCSLWIRQFIRYCKSGKSKSLSAR
jgi:hypothetical protein